MTNLTDLLSKMSLRDKLAEISQLYVTGQDGDDTTFMGIDYHHEIKEHLTKNMGSVLGSAGAAQVIALQKRHMEESIHKIPLIFMHDILHGYKTIFPSPLAMACTWQPKLIEKAAQIAAKEASVSGIHLTFSPMCDVARDARWGRVVESGGEDPYLNSLYAAAYVTGYQGDDIAGQYNIASCIKHFTGYGLAESGRDYNTTEISEYALREYHFPAYQAALDAGANMVMTSFNALNGIPASGNIWLFKDILRNEWNFSGTVISDCTAIVEMIYHGYAADAADAALKAINAGVDIEMVSTTYYDHAEKLLADGLLNMEQIDSAVLRVLSLKEKLGLFENPYKDANEQTEKEYVLCAAHRKAAREIAAESMVLLKNDGVLPLSKEYKKIAVLGALGDSRQMLDSWSAYGDEADCATLFEALREQLTANDSLIRYAKGCGLLDSSAQESDTALELAKDSDIIILALGEEPLMSGESGSRADVTLPGKQKEFAKLVFALGKPVVVVLYHGRPLAIPDIAEGASAILAAWFPGTEGNRAVTDILTGERAPSGRLTMSFPYVTGQCPIYYNRYSTGRPANDPYHSDRFSSRYVDAPSVPLYPFGYGLTYTDFSYGKIQLEKNGVTSQSDTPLCMEAGEVIKASVMIKNVGKAAGTETVQLYIRDVAASRVRPIRMLKGFSRVSLEPGQECEVAFDIDETMLRFHTAEHGYASEAGMFYVYIGKDAAAEGFGEFVLK